MCFFLGGGFRNQVLYRPFVPTVPTRIGPVFSPPPRPQPASLPSNAAGPLTPRPRERAVGRGRRHPPRRASPLPPRKATVGSVLSGRGLAQGRHTRMSSFKAKAIRVWTCRSNQRIPPRAPRALGPAGHPGGVGRSLCGPGDPRRRGVHPPRCASILVPLGGRPPVNSLRSHTHQDLPFKDQGGSQNLGSWPWSDSVAMWIPTNR